MNSRTYNQIEPINILQCKELLLYKFHTPIFQTMIKKTNQAYKIGPFARHKNKQFIFRQFTIGMNEAMIIIDPHIVIFYINQSLAGDNRSFPSRISTYVLRTKLYFLVKTYKAFQ